MLFYPGSYFKETSSVHPEWNVASGIAQVLKFLFFFFFLVSFSFWMFSFRPHKGFQGFEHSWRLSSPF